MVHHILVQIQVTTQGGLQVTGVAITAKTYETDRCWWKGDNRLCEVTSGFFIRNLQF